MKIEDLIEGVEYKLLSFSERDGHAVHSPEFIGKKFYANKKYGEFIFEGEFGEAKIVYPRDGFEAVEVIPEEEDLFGTNAPITSITKDSAGGSDTPPVWQTIADPSSANCYVSTSYKISLECDSLKEMLLEKNRKYGDSALSTGSAFDISPVLAIKARINDKISRLKNDNKDEDEDIIKDLLGYFILLRIAIKDNK